MIRRARQAVGAFLAFDESVAKLRAVTGLAEEAVAAAIMQRARERGGTLSAAAEALQSEAATGSWPAPEGDG